jgi:N-acetylmuramoyl-L-alanine amidase
LARVRQAAVAPRLLVVICICASLTAAALSVSQAQTPAGYTIVTKDGRRSIPSRTSGNVDYLPLDQIAAMFGLTIREDRVAGGVIVSANGQQVTLSAGQPLVSLNGRFVSLSGAVSRQGATWSVPADFLSRAVGPLVGQRIEVRKGSRLVLVDLRMPQVASRIDRQGPANGRLVVEFQPATAHRVTRDRGTLVVRFEADQLDSSPLVGGLPDFVKSVRIDGPSLVFELGPQVADIRTTEESERIVIDLLAQPAATAPPLRGAQPQDLPSGDPTAPPSIRTIVIDPGHGGDDEGVHGAGGTIEKDLTLQVARRLKTTLESRGGVRVLLARDADENVAVDRRAALANNNKADLFISLHANASVKAETRGAQVLSLNLDDYKRRGQGGAGPSKPVPVIGGGTRVIDAVPWELAQIPFASRSALLATMVAQHLADRNVPMFGRATDVAPLGVLVGANMPAVIVEMGFLTNADDERALSSGGEVVGALVEAIAATVADIRNGISPPPAQRPIR